MVCSGGLYFDPVCQYFVFWMVYLYLSNCFYSGQAQAATSCVNTALTAKEGISWNCVSLTTVTNRSPIINYHINIRTVMVMVQHFLYTPSLVSIKCPKKIIFARLFLVKSALFYLLDYYEVTYNCNWPWSTDCQGRPVLTGFIWLASNSHCDQNLIFSNILLRFDFKKEFACRLNIFLSKPWLTPQNI